MALSFNAWRLHVELLGAVLHMRCQFALKWRMLVIVLKRMKWRREILFRELVHAFWRKSENRA